MGWPRRSTLMLASLLMVLASTTLVGCAGDHGEPWINPGQEQRLGDRHERDELTEQQLRDRVKQSQTQR